MARPGRPSKRSAENKALISGTLHDQTQAPAISMNFKTEADFEALIAVLASEYPKASVLRLIQLAGLDVGDPIHPAWDVFRARRSDWWLNEPKTWWPGDVQLQTWLGGMCVYPIRYLGRDTEAYQTICGNTKVDPSVTVDCRAFIRNDQPLASIEAAGLRYWKETGIRNMDSQIRTKFLPERMQRVGITTFTDDFGDSINLTEEVQDRAS